MSGGAPDGADHGARPAVLVFAGVDPSGGAGIAADQAAILAQGAHALIVVTALTVQDNDRVYEVQPVDPALVTRQALALVEKIAVAAVKIGITGSAANARAIADVIALLRRRDPDLPVVLDPVLASGHGDALSRDDAVRALAPLLPLVTLLLPNGPEARALGGRGQAGDGHGVHAGPALCDAQAGVPASHPNAGADPDVQAASLLAQGCRHVLITGGHDGGDAVVNRWYASGRQQRWSWPRLPDEYHGSGCTLASAAAGLLARGLPMEQALARAQEYCHRTLQASYAIAGGQRIPLR